MSQAGLLNMSTHNSESSTGNSSSHELSSQPRKRAKVWEHFEQELVMVDGVPKHSANIVS